MAIKKYFILADANNFYVSCERAFNPKLQNKPVVVLSNNDGCIVSRSNEAKALGIPMGAPLFKFDQFFLAHDVQVVSSNFPLYLDISFRVEAIIREYFSNVEKYSIDECFISQSTSFPDHLFKETSECRKSILKATGIPVSFGMSTTKTLAKIGSKQAKKDPLGVCFVDPGNSQEILSKFDLEDVWGIGRRYAKKIKQYGITTVSDFVKQSDRWIKKTFSVMGLRTVTELRGTPVYGLDTVPKPRKQMVYSRSFENEITDYNELDRIVSLYAERLAESLRKESGAASFIVVFILTNRHKKEIAQYASGLLGKISPPSAYGPALVQVARECLSKVFRQGYAYKKAGVIVGGIYKADSIQFSLFDKNPEEKLLKEAKLSRGIDAVKQKWGNNSILPLIAHRKAKQLYRKKLTSSEYTTSWNGILTIKI